jgi:hypothetical protein
MVQYHGFGDREGKGQLPGGKMGTIQLMFSEFNTNNKQLGHDMINYREACHIFTEEHGGSRKGGQAVGQVLNKRLALDISRQTTR